MSSSPIQKPTNKQKKLLKSCVRCRKHKTKCDSYLKSPGACSNCLKKNHVCKIEFISPPKRFDNLKNLNNNLVEINTKINDMLAFYEKIRVEMNIKELKSYEEFKVENYGGFVNVDNSDFSDYNSDYYVENEDSNTCTTMSPLNIHDSCLLKLSNSKFVNITLTSTSIKINEFQHNIMETESQINQHYMNLLNFFHILKLSYNSSETSSIIKKEEEEEDLLSPLEAFRENKLLFAILLATSKNNLKELQLINQFLKDYLNSYYSIIQKEKLNPDSVNSLTSKSSSLGLADDIIFGKTELCNFLNLKFFNNDRFLVKLIKTLVLKFFINKSELDDGKFLIIKLLKIVELKLNLNRKNFNFEKNLTTEWKILIRFIIDHYYSTFDLHLYDDFKIFQGQEDENLQNLLIGYKVEKSKIFQNLNILSFNCPDLTDYLDTPSASTSTAGSSPASESSNRSIESMASSSTNISSLSFGPENETLSTSVQPEISHLQNYFKSHTKSRMPINCDTILTRESSHRSTELINNKLKEGDSDSDYEVILDHLIDWQKDSTDDVLMKINQLIKN